VEGRKKGPKKGQKGQISPLFRKVFEVEECGKSKIVYKKRAGFGPFGPFLALEFYYKKIQNFL
jgi:hypothetical protein